jgi:hypothetical protein
MNPAPLRRHVAEARDVIPAAAGLVAGLVEQGRVPPGALCEPVEGVGHHRAHPVNRYMPQEEVTPAAGAHRVRRAVTVLSYGSTAAGNGW